jgi:hypothetical protein
MMSDEPKAPMVAAAKRVKTAAMPREGLARRQAKVPSNARPARRS